ncbi:MAG TPA: alkaline phosphatase [Verrucomicrobiales bacterium]|nr:alkaline phosphatase [Verrucomicrobiales bacterium]
MRITISDWMNRSLLLGVCGVLSQATLAVEIDHLQGEMAGEATSNSVILQSRLTGDAIDANGDVPGAVGFARFEIADNTEFRNSTLTPWVKTSAKNDFMTKVKVGGLSVGTRSFYRLVFGESKDSARLGATRSFKTNSGKNVSARTSFVVVSGMNYAFFQDGPKGDGKRAYTGTDKHLGFPALTAIRDLKPDFFVGTGDNVYYDHHKKFSATDAPTMRKKWHEQFVQARFVDLFGEVSTYWEKDDHDHRYNDNDNTGDRAPSSELGIRIFREQVPVVDLKDPHALTYRTHRISRELQIWLLEGRDYRSPNRMQDGPKKTIWGATQRAWLKRTLLESDATYKIVISPTPMVGPDGKGKTDNHTNVGGFQHEGTEFFDWAKTSGFQQKGLYLACGDRHWQYHSIHPSGFEEFSSGALVEANSRMGVPPGTKKSTDPDGLVKQPYTSRTPSAGFLNIVVEPRKGDAAAKLRFKFFDENGELLHQVNKSG